ncbi:imidazole glycerol phosphate synthase subunit HisF [Aliidiomarina taiwanensis]|uniref:imidazole glycerol-phosphate synthase n=1 Tax=Aliidiomarina taiwanensis TaxID=946228 RepID=A0A432WTH2_9GAMM|nr:AglZ/HisF2 family acetamidino modification protein [Aliidiomarina taiwanensis]RUO37047.1 imidazole glycerol phosphate synthase subunit HisF [Aliidiomarina taiwanensis]
MLRTRVIPCLLVHNSGLVKTVKFKDPKYVGDPINAVKIFNEKEADELIVLDIDASVKGREPDYSLIQKLAVESRMPLCYGGGVKTAEQARKIIGLGVEKVALSSEVMTNPSVVLEVSKAVGTQSVVVVFDVKKKLLGGYDVYINNGKQKIKKSFTQLLKEVEQLGIGEIVVNSIDQDGVMNGYDLALAETVREIISSPLTILGGAGTLDDIVKLQEKLGVIGAAAGSLFVFKGPYKAVLINYPSYDAKLALLK